MTISDQKIYETTLYMEWLDIYHSPREELDKRMLPFLEDNFDLDNKPGKFLKHLFTNSAKSGNREDYPAMLYGMIYEAFTDLMKTEGAIKNAKI